MILIRAQTFTCDFLSPMSLVPYSGVIFNMEKHGLSSLKISACILHQSESGRGFSALNMRRFCAGNGLSLMGFTDSQIYNTREKMQVFI